MIRAKKIPKTSVKSEEILVSDLAARAVFGQSPLFEKYFFHVVSCENFTSNSSTLLPKSLQAYYMEKNYFSARFFQKVRLFNAIVPQLCSRSLSKKMSSFSAEISLKSWREFFSRLF